MENHRYLNFQNELRKLKLSAERGGLFSENRNTDPELEKKFLDYIERFEEQCENRKTITVHDYLNCPSFEKELNEEDVPKALDELMQYMYEHGIILNTIYEVAPHELYRFITEELFREEISDLQMDGCYYCFVYEEFYPNHGSDVEQATQDFIMDLFDRRLTVDLEYIFSGSFQTISGKKASLDQLAKVFEYFYHYYERIELGSFHLIKNDISIDDSKAEQLLELDYKAYQQGSAQPDTFKGTGMISFHYDYGTWYISGIDIPGLPL